MRGAIIRSAARPMPIPLGLAILDFAALLGLALASSRFGYRVGSIVLAIMAFVILAWGIVAFLTTAMMPLPPLR